MVYINGPHLWFTFMVHIYGSHLWFTFMVHIYGSHLLFNCGTTRTDALVEKYTFKLIYIYDLIIHSGFNCVPNYM